MILPGRLGCALACVAIAAGAAARDAPPATDDPALEHARGLLRECRPLEAAEAFAQILAQRPDDERAIAGRIESWIDADRWNAALAEVTALGERARVRVALASAAGAALFRAGHIAEAGDVLGPHADSSELAARGLSVLGAVRLAEGRSTEAVDLMRRALAADPDDPRVVLRAAEATTSRKEAVERLARYLEIGERDDADRREGARGTLEGLRALGERSVWRLEAAPTRLELPLGPLVGPEGDPIAWTVTARLGAKRHAARLLLDTGSGGLFLTDRVARRAGFEALAQETAFGGGGAGRHRSARGLLPALGLGDLRFLDALVTTTPVEIDPTGRYQGILGPGLFEGYRVTLDLHDGVLRLERGGEGLTHGVAYWVVAGQILVRAFARGGPDGLFLLDTGATASVLDLDYVAQIPGAKLSERALSRGYGGTIPGARRVENVQIELLGRATRGRDLVAADLSTRSRLGGVEIVGYVGMDLLGGAVLVLDPLARRLDLR